jgi:hypothetical protein
MPRKEDWFEKAFSFSLLASAGVFGFVQKI